MGTESAAPMSNRQRKRLAEAAAAGPIPEAVTVRAGSQVVEVTKQQFLALWNDPEVGGETIAQVLSWYAAEQYQTKYWGEHYRICKAWIAEHQAEIAAAAAE